MTDAPYKAERLKTKPLPLIPRRRKKAKNVTSSAKTAIKRAILRPSAGQKVAAMKEEDQSVKARTTIRKTVTRAPQPRLKSSNPISKHGPPLTKVWRMMLFPTYRSWQQKVVQRCKLSCMIQGHRVICPPIVSNSLLIGTFLLARLLQRTTKFFMP